MKRDRCGKLRIISSLEKRKRNRLDAERPIDLLGEERRGGAGVDGRKAVGSSHDGAEGVDGTERVVEQRFRTTRLGWGFQTPERSTPRGRGWGMRRELASAERRACVDGGRWMRMGTTALENI